MWTKPLPDPNPLSCFPCTFGPGPLRKGSLYDRSSINVSAKDKIQMVFDRREDELYGNIW